MNISDNPHNPEDLSPPLLPPVPLLAPLQVNDLPTRNDFRLLLGLAAVFFLIVGVFLPFIRVPFVGSINYFNNGGGDGVIVLILAGVSLYAVLRRRFRVLWVTGLLSAALTVFTVFRMLHSISKFGAEIQNKPGGNLFAGLAQSVQLDYGVAVIAVGIILTLVTAGYRETSQPIT